ncbi:PLxRFG domain-containing protein [Acinetobacter sp. YH01022]|uniref:PLxRFG domain-containing protein n=1 Tax=Acinetobacter sp. YH01022 TaxID=2601036 RepID=UPI0015D1729C|nr:PLxRFG domain-containing protein [Acinetobacter sp. YH01022]
MSDQNQIDWEKGTIQEPNQIDWDNGQISQPKEKKDKGFLGQAKDHAVSFLGKGTVAVGEVAVGLSDMMSDGATGKILSEKLGYDPKAAKNVMTGWQSEQYQQQLKDSANIGNRKIEEGDDFATKVGKKFDNAVDITKNAINNPSLITNTVAESLHSMLLGGVLGRASGIANPVVAGAVGEGAVMAGSQAEQIRQETVDGRLTADQSLAGAATGAIGGLFGYAGGRLAQKMGLSDVDTAMQTGRLTTQQVGEKIAKTPMSAIPTAVIKGAISEGFLEELPQSVSEQILQNLALDKPWHDGVENAAVMGTLAGMAMGGTVSGAGKTGDWWNSRSDTGPQDSQQQSGSPNLPSAPPQLGSNPNSALTGEYIPRENVPQGANQGRTAFVYDQPSMGADNLLNNNGFDQGNAAAGNPTSPGTPPAPKGNYFDDGYGSEAAFDDLLNAVPPASQTPSQQMGINPNDGPMSSAAALAVDSGVTSTGLLTYSAEQEDGQQLSSVPTDYRIFLGESQQAATQPDLLSSLQSQENSNSGAVSNNTSTATASDIETEKLDLNTRIQEAQQKFDAETSVAQKAQLRRELNSLNGKLKQVETQKLNEQHKQKIDVAANEAATSSGNNLPAPTQAQIEAGNYKKGHIKVHGLDIAIESPRGSTRSGKNPDGSDWSHTMSDHYGYIKKTKGADQEQLDVYVGKNPESERVFIVDQLNQDNDQFDEHKIMLGYQSLEEAEQAYKSNFDPGWKVGPIRSLSKDEFKSWLDNDDTVRPVSEKVQPKSDRIADKKEVVTTATGRSFEVQHKLVEAADLITSNNPNGQINPNYPQELQPRDRTRAASQMQITEIANQLNPLLLGENPNASDGAPIVSVENIVESGNGRSMAITKAYMEGKAEHYRQWLKEQGYNTDGMTAPVLVRERITPMTSAERIAYTGEANQRSTLELSDSEQAKSDAAKLGSILHQFYGGEIDSAQNRNFVKSYVNGIASSNERGSLLGADGVLTQKGLRRIQASLVARAYGDQTLISDLFESSDSNIKAIGGVLMDVSGFWANMLEMVDQGVISKDVDITANLLEAVNLIKKARREGRSVFDLMNQSDIFSGEIDQVTQDFLRIFYSGDKLTRARSREKVATALKYYIDNALSTKSGVNLFGENDPTGAEILRTTHEQVRRQETEKQQDIFTSPQPNEPDTGTVGGGRSGRGAIAGSETAQEQSEPTKALKKTAPTSEKETIQDFGEKIGGARKDTSVKTGPKTSGTTTKDNRPTWAKRFEITEIAASSNPNEVGKWIITDTRKKDWKGNAKQLGKQFFDSQKDAELALPILAVAQKHRVWAAGKDSFSIYREISDRKRVKVVEQEFQTREDAMKYMAIHAIEILETNTTFGEIDLPRPENTVRKGLDRRKGDAKDADFIRVFGFRGVEFGNWNNQAERQELLNDAFDGLMDLAEILNIPPAAISLNGELALAFGARGQGLSGAKAHYEPERAVINLTKLNGAGSLAHEWWHALDHYFGRQDGKAPSEWVTNADGSRSLKIAKHFEDMSVTSGFSYKSNVREDVQEAYKQLVQTIFRKSENYIEDTVKVESFVSSARNNLKDQLDKLRADLNRELDPKYYKRFNKAASAEQLAEFDTVAELLLTGTALTTEIRHNNNKNSRNIFSGARWSNDALDKLSVIYKSVRGRSGFNAEQKGVLDRLRQYMNTYAQRLKLLAEAQNGTEKAKMIPTDFAMNAKELDQGRGTDYWITTPEMTARAFQGYVEDKISQNSGYSPFLNFGPESAAIFTPWGFKRPFPTGTERKAINAKFSDLVDTLKTEETETGIKLYSRDKLKPDNERRGASPLDTTFTPLSVVSATRRVLSILQHLKMSATQDASSRGRINVSLNNRIGVNKVGNVNSNGFSVQVISSFSDLPKVIQNDATYKDENGKTQNYDVSGVWHDGTLYVVADQVYGDSNKQLTTFDAYEELLTHEIVGHFGVQKLFGNEYKTKFQQLFNALGKLEGIRKIAKDNGVDMQQFESAYIEPYTQGVKDEIYTESDVQQALVSELFAFIAQNAKSRPFVRQKLKEVIGYIRQWFRDRGFDKFLSRYNDADLMMFLSEARKAVVDRSYFGKYKNQEFSSKNNSDTPLYSRRTKSNSGSTTQQVRDVLIDRFGKETIDELERQGKLEIIQDYQVEGVEGFYYNGKAVLVASNLTAESTVPTFLHELGGHAGFQNMMTQKQYNELMNQFNKLVEQGNPVALAAKMLAEREQGSERQQLEYLPYLLTLSSTMQQRNVIQRNALQKLINNIVSYVKAWVFDNFGINLNLNPDDMLALSERMIGQIKHQSSLDLIRQKYHGTNQWMTAPNGAKTHLSEQQWLQVRTPEFKKWFGDWENDAANASQVLDENGEPKVVYHGTATEFNEFKQGHGLLGDGIYLTDSFDTADVYANIRGENGFVLPLFVNIRNAFKTTGNVSRDEFVEATTSGKYQGIVHQFENQEYIVALEPNQVKMAEGNTGTFNSESSDIRFSRSSNYDDITKRIANGFKNLPKIGDWINKKGVDWLKIGLGLLSRRHLTEVYGKLLPPLNKYNELAAQMDADKNDIAANADNIVREWSKLKDEEALANVMHDATLAQIDPAKPYQQGDNKVKYQQLIHAYNNLSPEAQAMYKKARNAYSGHYAKVREAIRERILRSALSSQKKADLLKNIEGSFGQIKGVYFPLARFGKYVVVLRNQNGEAEVVSRAETKNEAESVRAELIKKYPQYKADDVKKDAEFNASRDSVGRGFMSDLFDEVGNLGLDKNAQADFEDTLSQLYLSSMPDLSWAKHGIHRKGTAGFSQDARRAFAQHMFSGANYLGKLRYGDQLAQQIDDMKKYSNEQFNKGIGYDQNSASDVIDEMEKRHELLMNPKGNPLSSFLTSVGFMYYMGLSPAAAMVNLSQTALIAYPLMGAKWNYDKAGKELLKASKDFAKGVEFNVPDFSSLESFKNSIGDVYSPNIDKVIKGLELDAYNEAVKRGVIDVTQAHDLAGIAQGEDSKVMWYFRPAMRLASGMFHHAERFNREVTFIAAYRLASQAGATQTEAFEQAMDMVYRGHFDYSSGNRARYMQGNVAKVLLLFKQYAQNMIYTLVRNAHQSIYALDPKDQKEARRALAGILGMHALAAGAIGLPITGMLATASLLIAKKSKLGAVAFGVAALAALASGGDDDDPYELEIVIRNWLADIHPKFADLVFGGVPRAFSPVDLSGRVGLNNLIFPDVQDGLEGADWAKAMQSALLGPVVGIGTNIAKGFQEINDGDYGRGIETMLPVVLKNAMKSMRFANEGVLTKNKDVIHNEEVTAVELFSQAIGFSPSDIKTSMEGSSAIYKYKTKLSKHRSELMHNWVVARQNDDSDGMDKAWAEILKFNENVSEKNPKMRINRMNLMQSYKATERKAKETGDGGVYLTKRQKGAEEQGGFAFDR